MFGEIAAKFVNNGWVIGRDAEAVTWFISNGEWAADNGESGWDMSNMFHWIKNHVYGRRVIRQFNAIRYW